MSFLGALGIGLSVIFGAFLMVLLAELYYMLFRNSPSITDRRVNNVGLEFDEERGSYAREAAFVGSFGGYPGSPLQSEFVAKFFSLASPVLKDHEELHIAGMLPPPRLLFTIKEETREDLETREEMESEGGRWKEIGYGGPRSRTSSDGLTHFSSSSSSPDETPFATPPTSPLVSPSFTPPATPPLTPSSGPLHAQQLSPSFAHPSSPLASQVPASVLNPTFVATSSSEKQHVSSSSSSTRSSLETFPGTPPSLTPHESPPSTPLVRIPQAPAQNPHHKERGRSRLQALFDRSPLFTSQEAPRIASPVREPPAWSAGGCVSSPCAGAREGAWNDSFGLAKVLQDGSRMRSPQGYAMKGSPRLPGTQLGHGSTTVSSTPSTPQLRTARSSPFGNLSPPP